MTIHNIMEDIVREKTIEIFSDDKMAGRNNFCNCSQCQSDVICFVLNRIKPVYIFSARGAAHFKMNYLENLQREADLVTQIHRGIEQIARARRPHCSDLNETRIPRGPYFNFPTITGKLFHGLTFEPVDEVTISLYHGEKLMETINENWPNPYRINSNTTGIFTFLPKPLTAAKEGEEKTFEFELTVNVKDFEPLRHYFEISLKAESRYIHWFRLSNTCAVDDLYLVPLGTKVKGTP